MTSKTETVAVARDAYDAILAHAREGAAETPPVEVCGVLAGHEGDPPRVTATRRVRNVAADPRTRYELDPAATVEAIEAFEARGLDAVGFYHSHPESAPAPSATDRNQARWDGYVYAIAAPDDDLRAYRFSDESFDPLRLVVD